MVLFILAILVFVFAMIGLVASVALWVYTDAKVKSDQPPLLWVLLVLFTGIGIGILLYLLLGRTNQQVQAPGTHKKLILFFAIFSVIATGLFIAGTVHFVHSVHGDFDFASGGRQIGIGYMRSGSFTRTSSRVRNNEWTFTARTANGFERRSPNFSAEQLASFHVLSDSGNGLRLRLEQGDRTESIDISGFFNEQINMSAFEPGNIRLILEFDRANDVYVRISWRT